MSENTDINVSTQPGAEPSQPADGAALQGVEIEAERLPGGDELLARLRLTRDGQPVEQWDVRPNNEADFNRTCGQVAEALGVEVAVVEPAVADVLIHERRDWLRERQGRQGLSSTEVSTNVVSGGAAEPERSEPEVDRSAAADSGFRGDFVDGAEFLTRRIQHEWLVEQALVRNQVMIVGGPKKALKTSLLLDLAVSLVTGTPFLNHFRVLQRRRVVLISGESGEAGIQDGFRRVAAARGARIDPDWLSLAFRLPQLSQANDLLTLRDSLRRRRAEVAIIDPLYLALLSGNSEANPGNLYQMGPLLLRAARACLQAGATPIFCHHTTKGSSAAKSRSGEALDLEDLAFSGVAEVARQWLVVSHRQPFNPETGESRLWLRVGGSAGHAGLYALDVNEGVLASDFSGRRWEASVQSASKAIEDALKAREEEKEARKRRQEQEDERAVHEALRAAGEAKTAAELGQSAGFGKDKARRLLLALRQAGQVVACRVVRGFGTGSKTQPGWRLLHPEEESLTEAERQRLRNGECVEDVLAGRQQGLAGGEPTPEATAAGETLPESVPGAAVEETPLPVPLATPARGVEAE